MVFKRQAWHDRLFGFLETPIHFFISGFRLVRLDQLMSIVANAKLQFELSGEELKNSVLPHFFGYFFGSIDADVN